MKRYGFGDALAALLVLHAAAAWSASPGLNVSIGARASSEPPPVMVATMPPDGSTTFESRPIVRIFFNVDMNTTRVNPAKVVLPLGLTVRALIWIDERTLDILYDGALPTFAAKRVDLLDNYFLAASGLAIPPGSGFAFNFAPANTPPIIVFGPTANPATVRAGESVVFSVNAIDPEDDALTFTWAFGDGSTGAGPTATHAYNGTGPFLATVTVTDSAGNQTSGSVLVGAAVVAGGSSWVVTTATLSTQFRLTGRSSAHFGGANALPAGWSPAGQTVQVDMGGAAATFALTKNGHGKDGKSTCTVILRKKKKQFNGGPARLRFVLKGNFNGVWADEGLVNADTPRGGAPLNVVCTLLMDGKILPAQVPILWKSRANKSGRGTLRSTFRF